MANVRVPAERPQGGKALLAIVGEAPGFDETISGKPFSGPSGRLLNKLLFRAGVSRKDCLVTNVFDFMLPENDITAVCGGKPDGEGTLAVPVAPGKYVKREIGEAQLARLAGELESVRPAVVLALGGTALWALCGLNPAGAMARSRGTVVHATLVPALPVVPTYHPAYILRQWTNLALVEADIAKAVRVATGRYNPKPVEVVVAKAPEAIHEWFERYVGGSAAAIGTSDACTDATATQSDTQCASGSYERIQPTDDPVVASPPVAVDIETARGEIDCIGFCADGEHALVVPFVDTKTKRRYWPDGQSEFAALREVARFLEGPARKLMQNGAYDTWWIKETWGVAVRNYVEDTRTLHHARWPDLKKDLATMAATHCDLPNWKMYGAKGERER